MNILQWIKGKKKQKEIRKLIPDDNFSFDEYFYNNEISDGFIFVYSNNYTNKLYNSQKNHLSFISSKITITKSEKSLTDLINFINIYYRNKEEWLNSTLSNNYDNLYIEMTNKKINIYLRGNLLFYTDLCDNIHNNIITKYIRNNILPDELPIETPNEFLNNIYNSITNPNKEIDILFIEDNIACKEFNPVIGLSIRQDSKHINLDNKFGFILNNRFVTYCEVDKLSESEKSYIIDYVNHGNKLLDILHKGIEYNDIDTEIDEIIEG